MKSYAIMALNSGKLIKISNAMRSDGHTVRKNS